jgi:hypothetical protein
MIHRTRVALALGLVTALGVPAQAQTPLGTGFTYQGRLTDNGSPADGSFDLQFILYDALGGGNQVGPIVLVPDLAVSQGLFTVSLDFGAVFAGTRRWLEIGVRPGASAGAYSILSPRQDLTATPGALFSAATPWGGITGKPAGFADDVDNDTTYTQGQGITVAGTVISVTTGGITSAMIADGGIAGADIGIDVVTAAHIAPGAVMGAEIADSAVTSVDIAADTIAAVDIATGGVGTAEILDGAIAGVDIANGAVTAAQMGAGAVTSVAILDASVTSADIAIDTIQAADIGSGAVGASELGPDAVGTAHIQNGTIRVLDLNTADLDTTYLTTNEAYSDLEISGFLDNLDPVDLLTRAQADTRFLNTAEVLTSANYGGCGSYIPLNCNTFPAGSTGPTCDQVPVGGVCRAITGSTPCSTGVGACGDGSTWYLKVTP